MTKQELAESMAEFIGMQVDKSAKSKDGGKVWDWHEHGCSYSGPTVLIDLIFSPHGFFSVWDKVVENSRNPIIKFYHYGSGEVGCFLQENDTICSDRYTAFYSAVHEMINQRNAEG